MIPLLVVVCVVIVVWLLCILLSKPSSKFYVLDDPTHRSLHDVAKPRTGGIAIFSIILIAIAWLGVIFNQDKERFIYYLLVGMCLLAVISYLDDRYSISQIWRLITHFVAALLLVIGGLGISANENSISGFSDNSFVLNTFTVLIIVWMVNLFNFMDGMDGLAGGMGLIGFSCLAWLGWFAGDNFYMLMSLIVAAANFGFLLYNFPPAKIFMGDVGSITMGYLVAFFSLWGMHLNLFAWWAPILIFSPFIVDATTTLVRRLLCREKIWEAHKSHYYQKLVQNGWGHRKTAIFEYILMISVAFSVVFLQIDNNADLIMHFLLFWSLTYTLIILFISCLKTKSGDLH
ncbi:MAG: MraY family glycosyltransferase [Gammaproteobacteria bacterium]